MPPNWYERSWLKKAAGKAFSSRRNSKANPKNAATESPKVTSISHCGLFTLRQSTRTKSRSRILYAEGFPYAAGDSDESDLGTMRIIPTTPTPTAEEFDRLHIFSNSGKYIPQDSPPDGEFRNLPLGMGWFPPHIADSRSPSLANAHNNTTLLFDAEVETEQIKATDEANGPNATSDASTAGIFNPLAKFFKSKKCVPKGSLSDDESEDLPTGLDYFPPHIADSRPTSPDVEEEAEERIWFPRRISNYHPASLDGGCDAAFEGADLLRELEAQQRMANSLGTPTGKDFDQFSKFSKSGKYIPQDSPPNSEEEDLSLGIGWFPSHIAESPQKSPESTAESSSDGSLPDPDLFFDIDLLEEQMTADDGLDSHHPEHEITTSAKTDGKNNPQVTSARMNYWGRFRGGVETLVKRKLFENPTTTRNYPGRDSWEDYVDDEQDLEQSSAAKGKLPETGLTADISSRDLIALPLPLAPWSTPHGSHEAIAALSPKATSDMARSSATFDEELHEIDATMGLFSRSNRSRVTSLFTIGDGEEEQTLSNSDADSDDSDPDYLEVPAQPVRMTFNDPFKQPSTPRDYSPPFCPKSTTPMPDYYA